MMNSTAQPEPDTRARMTMRVYTVDSHGTITRDRGTVTVAFGNQPPPVSLETAYPPCECLRCRSGRAVRR
ncbi:hypothetical protein ABT187_46905 [Streptomyces sp. NPDC001817]|uniref:hypothetical protein n=1 Tax=Streptomyces sp. NPDC001817 TaxID=3154398 RepID=UPI00331F2750